MAPIAPNTTPVANNTFVNATQPPEEEFEEEVEEVEEVVEDEFIDEVPPMFSFGDQKLFREKIEEKGIEGVTRDIVSIVQPMVPQFNFTYEGLRDGSADILEAINPQGEIPDFDRSMSNEAILALLTDVEDYGKYDPPTPVFNEDGSPELDSDGNVVYEPNRYNIRAMSDGLKKNAIPAGVTTIGGWYGARAAATAYLAASQSYSNTGVRPYDVAAKTTAMVAGAVIGSQLLDGVGNTVNRWIFDEPDPIVVPSLQAAFNAAETGAYGLAFLASPLVTVKAFTRDLGEMFDASKTLENFRTIASKNFSPDSLIKLFGDDMVKKAAELAAKQADKGTIRRAITPDLEKGPTALRITDAVMRGGKEALENGRKNPKSWLGWEGLLASSAAAGAYAAEKISPGSEGVRFLMEITAAPAMIVTVSPFLYTAGKVRDLAVNIANNQLGDKARGLFTGAVERESALRLNREIRYSDEFKDAVDDEGAPSGETLLDDAQLLLEDLSARRSSVTEVSVPARPQGVGEDSGEFVASRVLERGNNALAPVFRGIEGQLATRVDDLAVSAEDAKSRYMASAEEAIRKLSATKNKEGLQLAASIEQKVMEQEIIDTMELANTRLINAAEKVFKGSAEPNVPRSSEIAGKFYDLQMSIVAALKQKRNNLYAQVGDFDIKAFRTREGEEISAPNMVRIFDISPGQHGLKFENEGSVMAFNAALGGFKKDIDQIKDYFNPPEGEEVADIPYPVRFARLKEMSQTLKATSAGIKGNQNRGAMDPVAGQLDLLISAINQDMTGLDAGGIFPRTTGIAGLDDLSLNERQAKTVSAYLKAKSFTYAMHNVISRTFVSQASKVNAQRGLVMDPSEAIKAVKDGDDIPLYRLQQMQAAANFVRNNTKDIDKIDQYYNPRLGQVITNQSFDSEKTALELGGIMEEIVRDARRNIVKTVIDPKTNIPHTVVDAKLLEAYKNRPDSVELFSIFPSLARDLDNLVSANRLVSSAKEQTKLLRKTDEQKAFSFFADSPDSNAEVINKILGGGARTPGFSPRKAMQRMVDKIKLKERYEGVTIAANGDEVPVEYTSTQVLDGLRAAISNYAFNRANGTSGSMSPAIYTEALFSPVPSIDSDDVAGGFTLIDFMLSNGIVDKSYVTNLQKHLEDMNGIERGIQTGDMSGALFQRPSASKIGMIGIGGAMLAGQALNRFKKVLAKFGLEDFGVGASIKAGEEGVKAAERMIIGPETLIVNNMAKIMADPKLLAMSIKEFDDISLLRSNLEKMYIRMGGGVAATVPTVIRDTQADESFLIPSDVLDRKPVYDQQRKSGELIDQTPVPNPPANSTPMEPPSGPAPSLRQPVSAAPQRPPVESVAPQRQAATQSGPVDRARFAALFPEDRELMGIGSLMENT